MTSEGAAVGAGTSCSSSEAAGHERKVRTAGAGQQGKAKVPIGALGSLLLRVHGYVVQVDVIAVQFNIEWENKAANFSRVRELLRRGSPAPGTLVALPEMFATGFSMNTEELAESYGGPTERFLSELAQEFKVFLLAGVAVRGRDGKPRNKALVFSPAGELIAFYTKMRPFSPGMEHEHYQAGVRPVVFRRADSAVAPFICYDLRFPELFRQVAASEAPELYVVIANWPEKRIQHWVPLLQARAIENQAYVVGVNRIGSDPFYSYNGHSIIIDANGNILADAGNIETTVHARLDLESLRNYRTGLPFLADIR